MILHNLVLSSRVNQHCEFSGIDSFDHCKDKNHFLSYPHSITYNYNSRGFRDQEWPDNMQDLRDAVWCIGDSFTVGLGSPLEHTWPYLLSTAANQRIINVSMDGASNEWIARITENIVHAIDPTQIAIMWSYTHRRENANTLLSDELRRIHNIDSTDHDDWVNFLDCKKRVDLIANSVQFAIPFFCRNSILDAWESMRGSDWPVNFPATVEELNSLPDWILHELENLHGRLDELRDNLAKRQSVYATVVPVKSRDRARDGHHFDLITADWVATRAKEHLSQK
jgi:hypothetical protein